MITILTIIQIILAIALVVAILLQSSAAGIGALGGGGDNVDSGYHTRRGFEKTLFNATVVMSILFALLALIIFIFS
jgi:preprotein translocase subunit SecG